ncbi:GNAT family N-acetyltransferase [Streptobacillus canis]|uniref:GNAT family N-acetyltransferase n=1 Tax=Streptobacillus canis TaxID=2678686 RepID=UPI0012E14BF3|nr:GNAT family N-acetyltransferase [Streptobacillus canis]
MNVKYQEIIEYNIENIVEIYNSVGWTNYTENIEMLKNSYENSLFILGAYLDEMLIGLIRVVGDGYSIIYIQDIIIKPEYHRMGIGSTLLEKILKRYKNTYQKILTTDNTEKTLKFYKSCGFLAVEELNCKSFIKIF